MQEICRLLDLDLGARERGKGPESASVFTMRKNKTGTTYSGNAGKCKSRVSVLRWDAGLLDGGLLHVIQRLIVLLGGVRRFFEADLLSGKEPPHPRMAHDDPALGQ